MTDEAEYTINDMRGDLAATIKALREGDEKMTIERAKAIGGLAQTMINSAKVEVDMLRAAGRGRYRPTGFVAIEHEAAPDEQDGEVGRTGRRVLPPAAGGGQRYDRPPAGPQARIR